MLYSSFSQHWDRVQSHSDSQKLCVLCLCSTFISWCNLFLHNDKLITCRRHSLFILLIHVGAFPQQQLRHLFPLRVWGRYSTVLTHAHTHRHRNVILASVHQCRSHNQVCVCVCVCVCSHLTSAVSCVCGCLKLMISRARVFFALAMSASRAAWSSEWPLNSSEHTHTNTQKQKCQHVRNGENSQNCILTGLKVFQPTEEHLTLQLNERRPKLELRASPGFNQYILSLSATQQHTNISERLIQNSY